MREMVVAEMAYISADCSTPINKTSLRCLATMVENIFNIWLDFRGMRIKRRSQRRPKIHDRSYKNCTAVGVQSARDLRAEMGVWCMVVDEKGFPHWSNRSFQINFKFAVIISVQCQWQHVALLPCRDLLPPEFAPEFRSCRLHSGVGGFSPFLVRN
jgi:hypothetical protein